MNQTLSPYMPHLRVAFARAPLREAAKVLKRALLAPASPAGE